MVVLSSTLSVHVLVCLLKGEQGHSPEAVCLPILIDSNRSEGP